MTVIVGGALRLPWIAQDADFRLQRATDTNVWLFALCKFFGKKCRASFVELVKLVGVMKPAENPSAREIVRDAIRQLEAFVREKSKPTGNVVRLKPRAKRAIASGEQEAASAKRS